MQKDEVMHALYELAGVKRGALRLMRGAAYFIVSALLLTVNTYEIEPIWTIALAIGILGIFDTSATIGRVSIAILAVMAVIPLKAIVAVAGVFAS
ncbi:hypothetical protein AAIH46_04645 [Rhizobium sp. 0TCS1.26]|uniref:hypothetical protein n=1 Tax=Rhizobium sp. 0TCS1.26 TaxID=3142623 RepID=UPI003D2E3655